MTHPLSTSPGVRTEVQLLDAATERFLRDGWHQLIPLTKAVEAHLRGVIADVLDHPGSLVRAQLAYCILAAQGVAPEEARALSIAIEYFHTASLLFDDLPSMDDAQERRGHPCPHRVHGEAAAILGALTLVHQAYGLLWQVLSRLPKARQKRASALVMTALGVNGILNGQALDLHFNPQQSDALAVAQGKTVSLVRLTLVLPAIVGGVAAAQVERLDRLATVWGLSYQILDDFKDCLATAAETGKSTARDLVLGRPNLPRQVGFAAALAQVTSLLAEGRSLLDGEFSHPRWHSLQCFQVLIEAERDKVNAAAESAG